MRNHINIRTTTLTAALSLVLAVPTFADSQYRSSQGISPSMTQTQGGQAKTDMLGWADADLFGWGDADRDGKLSSSEYQALQLSLQSRSGAIASTISAQLANKSVKDLKGMDVLNQGGKKIGNVDQLVLSRNNKVYAVISMGGFLGIGETEITMPLDQLTWHENKLITPTTASKKELEAKQEYNDRYYDKLVVQELEDNQVIGQLGTTSGGRQMTQSFSELDANQDGRIDRAEFSAFESQTESPSGSAADPASNAPGKSY